MYQVKSFVCQTMAEYNDAFKEVNQILFRYRHVYIEKSEYDNKIVINVRYANKYFNK